MNWTKTFSAIGLALVLLVKALVRAVIDCCINAKSILEKVKNMKNPQKSFSDVNEFMKLVTDDGDEADVFTDEQIKRMVGKNRKGRPSHSSHETEDSGMFDDEEDIRHSETSERSRKPPIVEHKPVEEPNLLGKDKKIVDGFV